MSQENNKGYYYEISVTYAVTMPVGENGAPVEVEKTENVKVLYLKRTNRTHTKLAMAITKPGKTMDDISEIAEMFVECAVDCEAKMKKEIKNDVFACINIYQNEKVQGDIDDFLLKLDFVRAAISSETSLG